MVVGFPHPNEPFGGLTAMHLARSLCVDASLRSSLGYTWHIAYCVDPDGARLNESWFGPGLSRSSYARGFYRPAGDEQVEWTFPLDYRGVYFDAVLPESLALMRLIDEVRPALMCSLHNSEVGGVYYYLTRALPAVHSRLASIPESFGLPLDVGEPEMAFIPQLAPAIFQQTTTATAYRFLEEAGEDPREHIGGGSSAEYAARHGTFTLVCEVPHWTDPRAQDNVVVWFVLRGRPGGVRLGHRGLRVGRGRGAGRGAVHGRLAVPARDALVDADRRGRDGGRPAPRA